LHRRSLCFTPLSSLSTTHLKISIISAARWLCLISRERQCSTGFVGELFLLSSQMESPLTQLNRPRASTPSRRQRSPSPPHRPRPRQKEPPPISTNLESTLPRAPSPPLQVREDHDGGGFLHFVDSSGRRYKNPGQWYKDRNIPIDSDVETDEDERELPHEEERRRARYVSQRPSIGVSSSHSEESVASSMEEEDPIYHSDFEEPRYDSAHSSTPPLHGHRSPSPSFLRQPNMSHPKEEEDFNRTQAEPFANHPHVEYEERRPTSSLDDRYDWDEPRQSYSHPTTHSFSNSRTKPNTGIRYERVVPPEFTGRRPDELYEMRRNGDYHTIPVAPPSESSNPHYSNRRRPSNSSSSRPPVFSSQPFPSASHDDEHLQRYAFGLPFGASHVHSTSQTHSSRRCDPSNTYAPQSRAYQDVYYPQYDERRGGGARDRRGSNVRSTIQVGFENGRVHVERKRHY